MIKYALLLLATNIYVSAYNQVINGTILDAETNDSIPFAAVYLNGTFVGSTSDKYGYFELDIAKDTLRPITISAIGYYSYTLSNYSTIERQKIYLSPKVYEIQEVSISSKSLGKERNENLILFRNVFLGETSTARKCRIINEEDITFNYYSNDDTLRAFTSKPILIENNALGYKITYYLDKFEHDRMSNTTSIFGNLIVDEDITINVRNNRRYERRREHAFLGSRMHFFRALWADDLESNRFTIIDSANNKLKYRNIVIKGVTNIKYLNHTGELNISYYRHFTRWSRIIFLKNKFCLTKTDFSTHQA